MPAALVLPIVTAIAGAASVGEGIYSLTNQPGTPKAATPTATGPSTAQATSAIAPQALTIENLTGGSVSPDYLASIAPVLAGVGGQPNTPAAIQNVLKTIFGQPAPTLGAPGATGSPTPSFTATGMPVNLAGLATSPGTSDFLTKLAGGLS